MRPLRLALALLALAPSAALAVPPPGPTLGDHPTLLERPTDPPIRSYGGDTFVLGDDSVHLVVSESDDPSRPARWQAFDDAGRRLWAADHACPDFSNYTTLFEVGGRGVCKAGRSILAVDLATGRQAWTFSDPRPLYITAGAQGRVAVSVANEQLAVLDAKTGKEVLRYDVEGAVLEAVAATPSGPLALLVHDSPGRPVETLRLPVGEGGADEEVELSGDDPGRALVALPIGGPAAPGRVLPMKPAWRTPFAGYSFDVFPSADVVLGQPREGVRACWDLATGALLWDEPIVDEALVIYGDDGEAFARPSTDAAGGWVVGARHPRTRQILWQRRLPDDDRPLALGQGDGDLGLVTARGFQVLRFADGHPLLAQPLEDGALFSNLRTSPGSVLWVVQRDGERWLHHRPLRR